MISIFLCEAQKNVAARIIAGVGYKSALDLSVCVRACMRVVVLQNRL